MLTCGSLLDNDVVAVFVDLTPRVLTVRDWFNILKEPK
jgi:hypothetical protein